MSSQLVIKALNLLEKNSKSAETKHDEQKMKRKKSQHKDKLLINKKVKSTIDEYQRKRKANTLEDNLELLRFLSEIKPKPETSQKILEHHANVLNKGKILLEQPKEEEPESVLFPELNEKKKKKKRRKTK